AAALVDQFRGARRPSAQALEANLARIEEAAQDLGQHLQRYRPRALGLVVRDGLWFSEPMEALRLVLTGRPGCAPLVRGHLGDALYTVRAIFGRETLELRDVADARFGGMLAI